MRIILVGETGTGKGYIQNKICERYNMDRVVTYTTRPKRDNEQDGVDYHFITQKEFDDNMDSYLEYQQYKVHNGDTWYYATPKEIPDNSVVVLDTIGAIECQKHYPNSKVIVIECGDETERFYRALKRLNKCSMENVEELYRRISVDKQKFLSFKNKLKIDFSIINDYKDLEEVYQGRMGYLSRHKGLDHYIELWR